MLLGIPEIQYVPERLEHPGNPETLGHPEIQ
jgi:hypothetical protein